MSEVSVLIGEKFGLLTVERIYKDKNGRGKCMCICVCGKRSHVFISNLKGGKTKSCGHLEESNRKQFRDISGTRFGDVTALTPTAYRKDKSIVWLCRCICGQEIKLSLRQLTRGECTKCRQWKIAQYLGEKIGELTLLSFNANTNKFRCECSCGSMVDVPKHNIWNGHTKSCGHLKKRDHFTRVNGIVVSRLTAKRSKNNTSGYKGVSKNKQGKWVAYITIGKKRYTLGQYQELQAAVEARQKAEEKYFEPIIKML